MLSSKDQPVIDIVRTSLWGNQECSGTDLHALPDAIVAFWRVRVNLQGDGESREWFSVIQYRNSAYE